jgi:hypothetical protein
LGRLLCAACCPSEAADQGGNARSLWARGRDRRRSRHLALLRVWESGSAEHSGGHRRRYRRSWHDADEGDDDDEFQMSEVLDWDRSLSEWRRPDNAQTTLGKLPLEDREVSPPGALDGMEPDEEHFREATDNEGAPFDRTYSRATLVIWPSNRALAVINMAGLDATLPISKT